MNDTYHLIGIGGIGMSNLAVLLKAAGCSVTGSDEHVYDPAASILKHAGIEVKAPYQAANLPTTHTAIVVGNALSRGHVELEEALRRGHTLYSFPEVLGRKLLHGRLPCVVAGTHGKSTTSACLAHLLQTSGQEPGFLFGAQPLNFETGAALGKGKPFVIEGDEYDSAFFDKRSKFLHYFPRVLVLGAIEYDHADIFPDIDSLLLSFSRLLRLLPGNGTLIYAGESEHAAKLAADARCPSQSFGRSNECDWQLRNKSLRAPDGREYPFSIKLPGTHNQLNALAAIAAANAVQPALGTYLKAAASFCGIRRRMELLAQTEREIVIDDFAHHPTAVAAAIKAARESWPDHHLTAIFEPRSNTSVRNIFPDEFACAFALADRAIIGSLHRERQIPRDERLDIQQILRKLRQQGKEGVKLENDDLLAYLKNSRQKAPAVTLFMSNGNFSGVPRAYADFIKSNS